MRYVGEPVAAVFAADPYIAEDAADLVALDIEPLAVMLDATGDAGTVRRRAHSTETTIIEKKSGDVDAAFRAAHAIVELDLSIGRHTGVPLETRGAIARYDERKRHAGNARRRQGAALESRPAGADARAHAESVQLYEGHVGGGFGIRGEIYPEDVLVCAAALKFRRPVKWIEDRREHLIAANHSRQQRHKIRAAIDEDGRILGIDDEFFHDNGAYMRTHAATVPDLAAAMLPGPYRVPAYRARGHIRLTNKTPCGTYRAPGRYETTFVRERLIDAIAAKAGIDAHRSPPPQSDRQERDALQPGLRHARHRHRLRFRRLRQADRQGARRRPTGRPCSARSRNGARPAKRSAPASPCSSRKAGSGRSTRCASRSRRDGAIEVITGVASIGQGVETAIAQIAAETLGVDYAGIKVVHGQTDRIDKGMGAFASRVTVMCGEATRMAAVKLREHGARRGRRADADAGRRSSTSSTARSCAPARAGPSMPLAALGAPRPDGPAARRPNSSRPTWSIPTARMSCSLRSTPIPARSPSSAIWSPIDIGKAVNPMLVEGQIVGGARARPGRRAL